MIQNWYIHEKRKKIFQTVQQILAQELSNITVY